VSNKLITGVIVVIIFGLALVAGCYLYQSIFPSELPSQFLLLIRSVGPVHNFSDRAGIFSVSGPEGSYPVFYKELMVDPFEVREGEKQYFSVWAKDPEGIDKVIGQIKTDTEVFQFNFSLTEGNRKGGRWTGSWKVKDVGQQKSYTTEITAYSTTGETTTIGNAWEIIE